MKRVNIHLDENWLKVFDAIVKDINCSGKSDNLARGTTRADIIRIALAEFFGFGLPYTHRWPGQVWPALKKAMENLPQ